MAEKKVLSYLLVGGRLSVLLYFRFSSHNSQKNTAKSIFAWEENIFFWNSGLL